MKEEELPSPAHKRPTEEKLGNTSSTLKLACIRPHDSASGNVTQRVHQTASKQYKNAYGTLSRAFISTTLLPSYTSDTKTKLKKKRRGTKCSAS